jgi:cardiolipin synthase A/B
VLELVATATTSLDVTIYQLYSRNVISALTAAAKRGVRVRVIQDWKEASESTMSTLREAGVLVKTSSRTFRFMHQKTMIADGKVAFVFSGNFDRRSFGSGRNFGVVLDDEDDLADFLELFEADWDARSPSLSCTRLVVSPVNARARILELVANATRSLDVEAMYVTDDAVIEAIENAKSRGVEVRVLLNDPSHEMGDSSAAVSLLTQAGIPVRRSGTLFVHAKLLVVDGAHAFVGSENFSGSSLDSNREAGLIVSTPSADVGRIVSTFESDWTASPAYATP